MQVIKNIYVTNKITKIFTINHVISINEITLLKLKGGGSKVNYLKTISYLSIKIY